MVWFQSYCFNDAFTLDVTLDESLWENFAKCMLQFLVILTGIPAFMSIVQHLQEFSRQKKFPVDIFGTVVGENPDCLLLSGTVVGENPDHVCWD